MQTLPVFFHGLDLPFVLGTLEDKGSQVEFTYSTEALDRGLNVSPIRLPLQAKPYPNRRGEFSKLHGLPGVVDDSLPDGWGLELMDRRMAQAHGNSDDVDVLERLAYLGANTMGALTYGVPHPKEAFEDALSLEELAGTIRAHLRPGFRPVSMEMARAGGAAGGARPKATMYLHPKDGSVSTQPSASLPSEGWLVKFAGEHDAPDSCALEELYARMATHCQLGMPPTRFFDLPVGGGAFGIKRFDRRGTQRIHMHSLAGLVHADFREPSIGYEDFFRATALLTRDPEQVVAAIQRCVFNVLMNNRDDHAKNLSFLLERDGSWRLAPPYDLTYCPGLRGEHFMDVGGEGRAPTRAHVMAAAARGTSIDPKTVEDSIDSVLAVATPDSLKRLAKGLPLRPASLKLVRQAMVANRAHLAS